MSRKPTTANQNTASSLQWNDVIFGQMNNYFNSINNYKLTNDT